MLDARARAAIADAVVASTAAKYEREFAHFRAAVGEHFSLVDVANYLAAIGYQRARAARPAIAFHLPVPEDGRSVLEHPVFPRLMQGLFREAPDRPARERLSPTFLRTILEHVRSWGTTEQLSPEQLRTRALIVFRLASWCRSSDAERIYRKNVTFDGRLLFFSVSRPKQATQSQPNSSSAVHAVEDSRLDPVAHVRRLMELRPSDETLFGESSEELASRVSTVLATAKVPIRAHALRHLGASAALALGYAIDSVAAHGGWRSTDTILRFYAQAWTIRDDGQQRKPAHISLAAFVCV